MVIKLPPRYPDSKHPEEFERGIEFQDFVAEVMHDRLGITITNYQSRRYQFGNGENKQGIEIKLDHNCLRTGRLSIETAEKGRASNAAWVPSGIYRQDNSWLYIQGTYRLLFVFAKSTLLTLHGTGDYEEHEARGTVRGYYLPIPIARRYAAVILESDALGKAV